MKRKYNNHTEKLFLFRKVHLCVWADCNASGALVYAYLSAWIEYNNAVLRCKHNGRTWVFKTIDEIYDGIGRVLSKRTINSALKSLVKHGYLKVGDFNKVRCNRTNYYALNRNPDEMPNDDKSPGAVAVLQLKKSMDEKNELQLAKKDEEMVDVYVDKILHRDYTGTYADCAFEDDYGRRQFCFTELDDEQAHEVVMSYVISTLKKGDKPNYKHFASEGVQQTLACRFAASYGC